jgi:hypothetical protein
VIIPVCFPDVGVQLVKQGESVHPIAGLRYLHLTSDLLSTIVVLPLKASKADQTIWPRVEIDRAGHCFLTWLHEIRHKGTFSKIATAFESVAAAVKAHDSIANLRDGWLEVRHTR